VIEAADAIPAITISIEFEMMSGFLVGLTPLFDQEIDQLLFALTIRFHDDVVRQSVKVFDHAFWRLLVTGVVADDFTFQFGRNALTGYIGMAVKSEEAVKSEG